MDSSAPAPLESSLEELEALLRAQEVSAPLGQRGVNSSLAPVAIEALAPVLAGAGNRAAGDFATAAEEVGSRLELGT